MTTMKKKKIDYKMVAEFLYDLLGYEAKDTLERLKKRYGKHFKITN